ncbi:RHOMBOID-like protein 12, mitochondrial isoform X3 [Apium graveolens]|uniref:RHOMBOID-like protein 12, mitochondrial isoform X3 n=1 Tax=Apium graveolens TaxID=4045 RepID=UPI003D7AA737
MDSRMEKNIGEGGGGNWKPRRSMTVIWIQRLDFDNVVLDLIVANGVVFLLWQSADYQFMAKNFMADLSSGIVVA